MFTQKWLDHRLLIASYLVTISPGHNQNWIYDDVTQNFNMAPKPRDTIQGHFSALCYT